MVILKSCLQLTLALRLPTASRPVANVSNECSRLEIMSALVPKVTRELTKMKRTLREVFNLDKLRPGQAEVMRSVLEGDHTLAIMPTGAGKSLCYQLPTLHLPGTTVVVSPLISLMKDQVDKLEDAGLEASQLNSALTSRETSAAIGFTRSASTSVSSSVFWKSTVSAL